MSKLNIYIVCVIIGYTIAAPVFEKPENQFDETVTISDDIPGLVSRDKENINRPREIIFEIIETTDAAQTKDVLVIDEPGFGNDDMELAETHIFRPLFRYRLQLERRERLRQSRG